MDEKKKYHTFPRRDGIKLRDLLPMIRSAGYSNYDELSLPVIICPECEEWTWVEFDSVSCCILDLLGDLTVESIDVDDNKLILWIKTDEFNWFKPGKDLNVHTWIPASERLPAGGGSMTEGVLIPGWKIPDNCLTCPFFHAVVANGGNGSYIECKINHRELPKNRLRELMRVRDDNCELRKTRVWNAEVETC